MRWTHTAPAATAPAVGGPEGRVVVALSEDGPSGGRLVTLEQANGLSVEGPFDGVALTDRPPLMVGARVYLVSKIGRVEGLDLAGQPLFSAPAAPLGLTSPLAAAPDGSLRVVSTNGSLVALDGATGAERWRASVDVGVDSPLAVGAAGTTVVATSGGRVEGFDSGGPKVVDGRTGALASGPSVTADGGVVVGDADGVRSFDANGNERFDHPRAARVVGTRVLADGSVLAWGDDGLLERLDATGGTLMRYRTRPAGDANPPPIRANPVVLDEGRFGVVDESGRAHLIGPDGAALATLDLGAAPRSAIGVSDNGLALVSSGAEIRAIDFAGE